MCRENYDFFYGGGYSIKEYYMESGNPRQMRGASELLNECIHEIKNLLKEMTVKEEHIITGGATLSAKVPRDKSTEIIKKAEAIFREKCHTANVAFVAEPFEGPYAEVKKRAVAKYEGRKMAKFISWEFQDADVGYIGSNYKLLEDCEQKKNSKIPVRCPRCRLRTPRYKAINNSDDKYLCTACAKREVGSNNTKYFLREQCGGQFGYDYKIDTVSKLADDDGRIALLYADINNLGGYSDKFSEFEADKIFHEKVERSVKNAVFEAINKALRPPAWKIGTKVRAKFEIIALGGDDICLLLPGKAALLTAKLIMENLRALSDDLTISVSACVANDTTALTYMENIVAEGLIKAKRYARKRAQSALCLSFFEKTGQLFPMTAAETEQFFDLLDQAAQSAAISPTALRNIAEARREMAGDNETDFNGSADSNAEFSLYLDYYLSRDTVKESKELLEKIRAQYHDKDPWLDFVTWRHQSLVGGEY